MADSEPLSLSLRPKLGYGIGNMGLLAPANAAIAYLLYFYSDVVALSPLLVGVALTTPRFWDAISDPMMGVISDRTRFASGRRRPYILWGAPLLSFSFVLLWYPFAGGSPIVVFAHLFVANMLFTTAVTAVGVPYTSLGGELSADYHERTTVFAYSQAFGMVGGLIGMAMKPLADSIPAPSQQLSFLLGAVCLAVPSCLFLWVTYLVTRETAPSSEAPERASLKEMLRANLRNRSFRNLALTMTVVNSGMMLGVQFLPFMLKYWVKLEHLLFPAYAAYTAAVYLGFPLWKKVGERLDKKHVLTGAFTCAGLVYALSFVLFQPGATVLMFTWAILVGLCGAGGILYPFSMIADIADEDELETGFRSEGVFYGAYSFIGKLSVAVGSMIGAIALWLAGFEAGQDQSATTLLVFRLVYVAPVISFLVAATLIYRGYSLTEERAAQIKQALRDRKGQT